MQQGGVRMSFATSYVVGGELDKVKYIENIKNFAQFTQPYNKMILMNVPAIAGVYELEYETIPEEVEVLSVVITCSGYGENDYYNLYVDDQKWFDTWFPTEVKEGLFIGTSTYVCRLEPKTKFKLQFINISGSQKKVWLGIRMLIEPRKESSTDGVVIDTGTVSIPVSMITDKELEPLQ